MTLRRYAEAQRCFELCISLFPDENSGYYSGAENLVRWKGDTKGARALLNRTPHKENPPDPPWLLLELCDRRYQAALGVLSNPYLTPVRRPLGKVGCTCS
jgi:hypothetical protein